MDIRKPVDIVILSNGPGELATWVRPVVKVLRHRWGDDRDRLRISLVLSPCPHASGREAAIARTYPEIDRVQDPQHFFPFLLWGKTADSWDWRDRGTVLFLGGDQFYPVVIGKRLGYRTLIYAEWEARWHRWIDRFAIMRPEIATRASSKYASKFTVIGDLMAETTASSAPCPLPPSPAPSFLIGLLPGSKTTKLAQGVPLLLAIAERIHAAHPQARFVIPVAPALSLSDLARFADPQWNAIVRDLGNVTAELVTVPDELPYLKTIGGVPITLWTTSPAYDLLAHCHFCLTTVGANTAELGSLGVPMIVLLPTQRLDALPLDGLLGLITQLPGVGKVLTRLVNWWALRQRGLLAWPNIWAGKEIVPELVGHLDPQQVADHALDWLSHPEKLQQIRTDLRKVRGETGAAVKLVQLVEEEIQIIEF